MLSFYGEILLPKNGEEVSRARNTRTASSITAGLSASTSGSIAA